MIRSTGLFLVLWGLAWLVLDVAHRMPSIPIALAALIIGLVIVVIASWQALP